MKRLSFLWRGLLYLFTFIFIMFVALTTAAFKYETKVNEFLGTSSFTVEGGGDSNTLYYESDFDNIQDVIEYREDVMKEISAEGSVLLKNIGGTLPLNDSASPKVTLLGMGSYDPTYGEVNGSAKLRNRDQIVSLIDCFKNEGFDVNPTMVAFYEGLSDTYFSNPKSPFLPVASSARIGEVPMAEYTSAQTDSYADYNDAAIVVIRRQDGEVGMLPMTPEGIADGDGIHNYTELQNDELALIEHAKQYFDKVIVIINSASAMCIDDLKQDDGIGAILQVAGPGSVGFHGVADLLLGKADPSGGLAYTFPVDSWSSPAMQNTTNSYGNSEEIVASYDAEMAGDYGSHYIVEAEGIYVGYKYYETRYYDLVLDRFNADSTAGTYASDGAWSYADEVSYSFGYGLSYTTFDETLDSISFDEDEIVAQVTVTNTGDTAGKHAVQLYVQLPYTETNMDHGVEKAAIQLVGYEKTDMLEPGQSQEMTIRVDSKYIASWDSMAANGEGSYILDAGDYYFAIGNGAHDALNNVLAAQGKTTADGMDYDGNASFVKVSSIGYIQMLYADNGVRVSNRFEGMDYNYYNEGSVTYLTRSDWNTFPVTADYQDLIATEEMMTYLTGNPYEPSGDPIDFEYGQTYDILYTAPIYHADSEGNPIAYDDPFYDYILNQFMLDELAAMAITSKPECERIVLPRETGSDGPNGVNSKFNTSDVYPYYIDPAEESDEVNNYNCGCYQSSVMTASTFSHEMAEKQARAWGNDSLWTAKTHLSAPAVNIIRTPFNGRNSEYMSEDSQLSNLMAIDEVTVFQGEYGGLTNIKHFAFYETETERMGLSTFNIEQAAREIYLRAFQGAIEDADAHQVMAAFPRVGIIQCNYSENLLNNVLRGEWGFLGTVGSDNGYVGLQYPELSLLAGSDGFIDRDGLFASHINAETLLQDGDLAYACREAAHRAIWQFANSNMINGYSSDSKIVPITPAWQTVLIVLNVVFGVIAVGSGALYIVSVLKNRKEEVK